MANHKLQLMTYSLSSKESTLSLSTSSMAFISKVPPPRVSSDELHQLIQSRQLWLLSSGLCRLEVIVELGNCQMTCPDSKPRFLEYIADAICQCSVWSTLGLAVNQLAVHDEPLHSGDPNLYFSIEHPDKSCGLLSPTHVPAVHFQGLEFLLHFHSEDKPSASHDPDALDSFGRNDASQDDNDPQGHESSVHHHVPDDVSMGPRADPYADMITSQFQHEWSFAAHLVQAALHTTIGVKRPRGLQLLKENDNTLPLLKIAPSIWNAHYLQLMATHSKNFPIISSILAASVQGQSPALRRKVTELLEEDGSRNQRGTPHHKSDRMQLIESSIQKRLWGLLQTTLEPNIRPRGIATNQSIALSRDEPYVPSPEMLSIFPNSAYYDGEHTDSTGFGLDFESNAAWSFPSRNDKNDYNVTLDTPEYWHVENEEGDAEFSDQNMVPRSILEAGAQLDQDLTDELYTPEDIVYDEDEDYLFHADFGNYDVDWDVLGDDECVTREYLSAGDTVNMDERWHEFRHGNMNTLWNLEFDESEVVR
ncbi:hypothetical protein F4809DRAFT_340735 [Biscogniauxia mediterranea]|nr:hypothetical protein F4809DRAFT_340735 [Biscogniauxia mediterranea]